MFAELGKHGRLSVNDNQISEIEPGAFDALTSLTSLTLSDNRLTHLPDGLFAKLTSLESLSLSGNDLGAVSRERVGLRAECNTGSFSFD